MGTKANRSKLKHLALSSKGNRKLIRARKKTSLATGYKIKFWDYAYTPRARLFHCMCLRI